MFEKRVNIEVEKLYAQKYREDAHRKWAMGYRSLREGDHWWNCWSQVGFCFRRMHEAD